MRNIARISFAIASLVAVTACGSQSSSQPSAVGVSAARSSARPNDYGNIRWNKAAIHLYKSRGAKSAILTYWARDGYFLSQVYCQNGGNLTAVAGRTYGNPNRYDHTHFKFTALTSKPDTCSLLAILANTGSPPLASITVYLNS